MSTLQEAVEFAAVPLILAFSCLIVQTAKDRWREGFGAFFESFSRLTRAKDLLLVSMNGNPHQPIVSKSQNTLAHATHQYPHDPIHNRSIGRYWTAVDRMRTRTERRGTADLISTTVADHLHCRLLRCVYLTSLI